MTRVNANNKISAEELKLWSSFVTHDLQDTPGTFFGLGRRISTRLAQAIDENRGVNLDAQEVSFLKKFIDGANSLISLLYKHYFDFTQVLKHDVESNTSNSASVNALTEGVVNIFNAEFLKFAGADSRLRFKNRDSDGIKVLALKEDKDSKINFRVKDNFRPLFRTIVFNMVFNAFKHSKSVADRAKVKLELKFKEPVKSRKNSLIIRVSNPFDTSKLGSLAKLMATERQGLKIIKASAEKMGGKLSMDKSKPKEVSFQVEIPITVI